MDEFRALEAENRILDNNFQDLEFQLAEMIIKREHSMISNVTALQKRLLDLERELEHADRILTDKYLKLEFMNTEHGKQQDEESIVSADKSQMEEQLNEMKREIEQNTYNLEVLQNERNEALTSMKSRETYLSMSNKPLPKGWMNDRDSHLEEREALLDALEAEKEKLEVAKTEFANLQLNHFTGTNINPDEMRRALSAELKYTDIDPFQEAIEQELEYRKSLKRELEEAKAAAKTVKSYRDRVVERHQQQFELASLQARLEALHENCK